MTRTGGCLCGAVRYTVDGELREILVCHCHECRRWSGRAWAATAARRAQLTIDGEEQIRWFPSPESDHAADRGSCSRCGATMFWSVPGWRQISIAAGTLDDSSALSVAAHIWTDQAAAWEWVPTDVPSYPRGYPDDGPRLAWT